MILYPVSERFLIISKSSIGLKMTVFWDVASCSLIELNRSFRSAYCLHHQGDDGPDDGGGNHL
jgi:hypothetical protein